MTDCPTLETLSGFIDGKLTPDSRERVAAHLGDCELCYATLAESLTIRDELYNQSQRRRKKYLFYVIPASLAAAAVLFLAFRVLQPAPGPIGPSERALAYRKAPIGVEPLLKPGPVAAVRSYAGELSASLAGKGNAALRARIAGNSAQAESAYGFSSIVPMEKAAFRIGMCLTDLEVALHAKDRENSEVFARKLIDLLKPLESSLGPFPIVGSRGTGKSRGAEAGRYEDYSSEVEALFKNRKEAVFLNFGEWVEAAALAADVRDAAFFQPALIRRFKNELEMRGVPVGTMKNLSHLESISSSGGSPTDQFRTRARLLADIKEMF